MISYGKQFHRPVVHSINMLTPFHVPITIMLKKIFPSLLPGTLLHPFISVSTVDSLGAGMEFWFLLKSSQPRSPSLWLQPVGCRVISCQQWWWWWLTGLTGMGLEGIEGALGPYLRCNHNHDHGKSSHTSLTTHTLVYWTKRRHLLVSPEDEMVQKFAISLGSAALPALRCLMGSSYMVAKTGRIRRNS